MEQREAQRYLFENGILASWYLREPQLDLYDLLLNQKNPFIECARRFGKTTAILCFVFEKLIQNPGSVCLWAAPWKNQAREILMPEVETLRRLCSKRIRPEFKSTDSYYVFPNESRLKLRGINDDQGESARGPFAHLIIADEFGSWNNPDYVVKSALRPQLETTKGPFIFASTPPPDLGHAYYKHKERAMAQGRFIQKTWRDKTWLTPADIEELADEYGGMDSDAWRREQNCEEVPDQNRLIVGEYRPDLTDLPDHHPRPEYFDAYVGGDSGADDNTAILYAYWDYERGEIVFEDELILSGQTTPVIVEESRAREAELWGTKPCTCALPDYTVGPKVCFTHGLQPYRRVYDADKQLLIDITVGDPVKGVPGYPMELPEKTDKQAAIRWFKRQVQTGKVRVKERCQVLRRQLRVGQWANEKHLDFQRSEDKELKHLDALAAAIYTVRSINVRHNPFPQAGPNPFRQFVTPEHVSQGASRADEQALAAAFDPLGGGDSIG